MVSQGDILEHLQCMSLNSQMNLRGGGACGKVMYAITPRNELVPYEAVKR